VSLVPARSGILAAAAVATALAAAATSTSVAATARCSALAPPPTLGATLLRLHREYMSHQPDVHDPTIKGPVGHVLLGRCGTTRYALATFDARYNGVYFGSEDQPERFVQQPGGAWRDIGNTGGPPCGSAPTALLEAWKIVRSCPG